MRKQWRIDATSLSEILTGLDLSGLGRTPLQSPSNVSWNGELLTTAGCNWTIDPGAAAATDNVQLAGVMTEGSFIPGGGTRLTLYVVCTEGGTYGTPYVKILTATGSCTDNVATLTVVLEDGVSLDVTTITATRFTRNDARWYAPFEGTASFEAPVNIDEFGAQALYNKGICDRKAYTLTTHGSLFQAITLGGTTTGTDWFEGRTYSTSGLDPVESGSVAWDLVLHAYAFCAAARTDLAYIPVPDSYVIVNGAERNVSIASRSFAADFWTYVTSFCGGWYLVVGLYGSTLHHLWTGIKLGGSTPAGRYWIAPEAQGDTSTPAAVMAVDYVDIVESGDSYFASGANNVFIDATPSGYSGLTDAPQSVTFAVTATIGAWSGFHDSEDLVTSISPNTLAVRGSGTATVTLGQNRSLTPYTSHVWFACYRDNVFPITQGGCASTPSLEASSVTVDGDGYGTVTLDYICEDPGITTTPADDWITDAVVTSNEDEATYKVEVYADTGTLTANRTSTVAIVTANGTVTLTVVQNV